eukprot:1997204-Lingulodinium_polyedra.AAC.1
MRFRAPVSNQEHVPTLSKYHGGKADNVAMRMRWRWRNGPYNGRRGPLRLARIWFGLWLEVIRWMR